MVLGALESTEVSAVPAVMFGEKVVLCLLSSVLASGQLQLAISVLSLLTFFNIKFLSVSLRKCCTVRLRHPAGNGDLWP